MLLDTEVVSPIIRRKEHKIEEKVKQSRLQAELKSKENLSFEQNIEDIEKQFKHKQLKQLEKYENYFQQELDLKLHLKELTQKRADIVHNIESCDCYG